MAAYRVELMPTKENAGVSVQISDGPRAQDFARAVAKALAAECVDTRQGVMRFQRTPEVRIYRGDEKRPHERFAGQIGYVAQAVRLHTHGDVNGT